MAMVDAGFPMKCLVCAVTCTMNESGEVQLDPTSEQEKVRTLGKNLHWTLHNWDFKVRKINTLCEGH